MEAQDLRTLQGEKVKSYEELQIANWLYENGVEYEYEPVYEHKIPETGRRDYQPDFRVTESCIYIEHFGVRRQKMADGSEQLVTAPFVDREEYLAGMEWKRQVHAEHETTLIETYSYERQEGRLLTGLAEKLAPHVTPKPRPADTIYDRIVELKQVDDFSKLLGTFLRKFKSGGYSLQDCETKSDRMKLGKRARAFLDVFAPVFEEYKKRLEGRIDFEDMILRAAHHAETGRYKSPFRHILVDEFQDISQGRARLVKALKAQHPDVRVFAVGDDWQSIFRFAGSDIHLMRHFGREFGGSFDGEAGVHRTVDLGRTFRSVDQIAFAARTFVLRNPAQIQKQIVPAGTATEPAIRVVTVSKGEDKAKLSEVLAAISPAVAPETKPVTVLLLGRYRFVEPDLQELRRRFPRLTISFKTIHASKGLEADHVVLLNADSGRTGFPLRDRRRPPAVSSVAGGGGVPERRRTARHVCRDDPGPTHPDDPCLERPAIALRHRAEEGSRLRHRRSTWRRVGGSWLRRMRWAVAGRHREGRPHMVSLRACPALRKPAARLPILRYRSATPRGWNGRGSMWVRCQLSDVPQVRRWLDGRAQRQLWKIPWLRPLSDLRWESETIERRPIRNQEAATPKRNLI